MVKRMPRRERTQAPRVLKPRASVPRVLKPRQLVNEEQHIAQRTRFKAKSSSKHEVEQPIAHRTRSKVEGTQMVAGIVSNLLASSVLDQDTGKLLEPRQLRRHPTYKHIWDMSCANELKMLCQRVGQCMKGSDSQRVKDTNIFCVIWYEDITPDRRKEVCHTSVVCKIWSDKDGLNRTQTDLEMRLLFTQIWGWGSFAIITSHLAWGEVSINEVLHGMRHLIFSIKLLPHKVGHLIIHIASVRCLRVGLPTYHLSLPCFCLTVLLFCWALHGTLCPPQGRSASKVTYFVSWGTLWLTHCRGASTRCLKSH